MDFPEQRYVACLLTAGGVAAGFLGTALLLWWRRRPDPGAGVFLLLSAVTAGAFLCLPGIRATLWRGARLDDLALWPAHGLILLLLLLACVILGVCVLLHLGLVFPRRRPVLERGRAVLWWVYALALFTTLSIGAFVGLGLWFDYVEGLAPPWWLRLPANLAVLAGEGWLGLRVVRALRARGLGAGLLATPLEAIAFVSLLPPVIGFVLTSAAFQWQLSIELSILLSSIPVWISAMLLFAILIVYTVVTGVVFFRSWRSGAAEDRARLRLPLLGSTVTALVVLAAAVATTVLRPAPGEAAGLPLLLAESAGTLSWLLIPISFAAGPARDTT